MRPSLVLVILLLASTAHAQAPPTATSHSHLLNVSGLSEGYFLLHIDSNGVPTVVPTQVTEPVTTPTPDNPDPPSDTFGLSQFAADAVQSEVAAYPNRDRDATRLGHVHNEIAALIANGTIKTTQGANEALQIGLDTTLRFSRATPEWRDWRDTMNAELTRQTEIDTLADLEQAYREIGDGLTDGGTAFGDGAFLKFFIEVILPLILKLLAGGI